MLTLSGYSDRHQIFDVYYSIKFNKNSAELNEHSFDQLQALYDTLISDSIPLKLILYYDPCPEELDHDSLIFVNRCKVVKSKIEDGNRFRFCRVEVEHPSFRYASYQDCPYYGIGFAISRSCDIE